jgi:hypothetical protein
MSTTSAAVVAVSRVIGSGLASSVMTRPPAVEADVRVSMVFSFLAPSKG